MSQLDLQQKLAILADAAKYDASCASSGTSKRDSRGGKGVGSTEGMGICHAYAPDGRCISLLKILLTNSCIFDCHYCINRKSSNVRRARFTAQEVVRLTLAFYRRNYIEGLFLSSGIIRSPDYTMEQLVQVARTLREQHQFQGYIHLKTVPGAAKELIDEAGRHFGWTGDEKRRLHQTPNRREVLACKAWLEAEVAAVKPRMIVCLGATAAQAFLGPGFRINHSRGRVFETPWAPWWMATFHPSALLRMPDEQAREEARAHFEADLRQVAQALRAATPSAR